MGGDQHIEEMMIATENSRAWRGQFHTDHHGHAATDQAADDGKYQVHGTDIFVVRGIDPAPPAGRNMVVVIVRRGGSSHLSVFLSLNSFY